MPRVQGKTIENMAPVQFRIIQMRSFVVTTTVAVLHINWFNAALCQEWRVKPLKIWHHLVNYENVSSGTGYTCNWNFSTTQDLCLNQVQNWKAIIWSLCWTCQSIQVNTNVFSYAIWPYVTTVLIEPLDCLCSRSRHLLFHGGYYTILW